MPFKDNQAKLAKDNAYVLKRSREDRDVAGDFEAEGRGSRGESAVRDRCRLDLKAFCSTYFPNAFNLPWSDDHLRAIGRMERIILDGGLFALAMPRASGKTALSIRAAIWALLYKHRRFVCLVAATEGLAGKLLKQIKTELCFNDLLDRDFGWVTYPLRRLENNARKAIGQLWDGEQTRIDWSDDRLTLATVPDAICKGPNVGGSTITVAGLTGALRGQSHTLATGEVIRPEVVILDDPQTRESAMSPAQSEYRAAIIQGDVLGMAGPGRDIAAIMPCTVIRDGDMASVMLDRAKNPEWSGQRTKMVYAWPGESARPLWEEYRRIRDAGFQADRGPAEANAFYAAHRQAMDAGAVVAWPERFGRGEISAIQHAMNLRFRNEFAFFAEYQNEPLSEDAESDELTADGIAARLNRHRRGVVPSSVHRLTAFVDVQSQLLYWVVCGWSDDFGGHVLDYGCHPDQKRPYFAARDARITLERTYKAAGLEGRINAGLEALVGALMAREWPDEGGTIFRVERLLIDANWGESTRVVHEFCRRSPHAALLVPAHGRGITAAQLPMADWPRKAGDRAGFNWRLGPSHEVKGLRKVIFDANFWKSFVHARLSTAIGDRGALDLYGDRPELHRLFADHLTSETRTRTEGRGRVVHQWTQRPQRPDNHWWDCLVGSAVAASMQGVTLAETAAAAVRKAGQPRPRMSDLQRQRGRA